MQKSQIKHLRFKNYLRYKNQTSVTKKIYFHVLFVITTSARNGHCLNQYNDNSCLKSIKKFDQLQQLFRGSLVLFF